MRRLYNQIFSRKFFVLIISVILFWCTEKFSADHLVIIFCIYMGVNVVDGFIAGRWGNGYSQPSIRETSIARPVVQHNINTYSDRVHPGEAE